MVLNTKTVLKKISFFIVFQKLIYSSGLNYTALIYQAHTFDNTSFTNAIKTNIFRGIISRFGG